MRILEDCKGCVDDINKEISIDWSNTPIGHIVNSHARFVLEIKSHTDNSETLLHSAIKSEWNTAEMQVSLIHFFPVDFLCLCPTHF